MDEKTQAVLEKPCRNGDRKQMSKLGEISEAKHAYTIRQTTRRVGAHRHMQSSEEG